MTKEELFEKLKPMALSLQNKLTSKQHAFNSAKEIIDQCKRDGINNKLIVEAINSHLEENEKITLIYFKNLLSRSKSKKETTVDKRNTAHSNHVNSTHAAKNGTPEKTGYDESHLSDYLKVCFGAERLAIRAMEAGVSIETIKSWNCPNSINLGTTLSNFIQNR